LEITSDIPLPTEEGRKQLFSVNLKGVDLGPSVDLDRLAKNSEGYSGADITNVN